MSYAFASGGSVGSTGSQEVFWIGRWINDAPGPLTDGAEYNVVIRALSPYATLATERQIREAGASGANWCLPGRFSGSAKGDFVDGQPKRDLASPIFRKQDLMDTRCTYLPSGTEGKPAVYKKVLIGDSQVAIQFQAGINLFGVKPSPERGYPFPVKWADPITEKYCLVDIDKTGAYKYVVVPWSFILSDPDRPFQYYRYIPAHKDGGLPLPDISVDTSIPAGLLAGLIVVILASYACVIVYIYYFRQYTLQKMGVKSFDNSVALQRIQINQNSQSRLPF